MKETQGYSEGRPGEEGFSREHNRAAWEALLTLAIEMGFDIQKMSMLKYNHIELRNLMVRAWRERVSLLKQCQGAYKKLRKENDAQEQVVMNFHLQEETP